MSYPPMPPPPQRRSQGWPVHLRFQPDHSPAPVPSCWTEPPLRLRFADGSFELMGLVHDLDAAARYALSFGAAVEVLGPKALRQRLARESRQLAALYDPDASEERR